VLHTYVELNKPRDWGGGIDFSNPATALARVAKEFDGWAPELAALITCGETALPRPIHTPPAQHRRVNAPQSLVGFFEQASAEIRNHQSPQAGFPHEHTPLGQRGVARQRAISST
jgi:hypothetical protein